MKIDPNSQANQKAEKGKFENKILTAGNKLFAPVGVSYIKPRDKVILEITSVCIKDKENKGEEGALHRESFWLTPNASWKIANWSIAMGNSDAFDSSDREDIEKIIANGVAFHGVVSIKKHNGYENRQIDSFYKAEELLDGDEVVITDEMDKLISTAEEAFPKIVEARKQKGVTFVSGGDTSSSHDDEIPF
tara:strand:- start:109 stop:681 length:573 start_codon:yes stop_codon:yes gene_type:complete